MTDPRKQVLAVLSRVAEFLETLPEDQLNDLESGAARLTVIPAGSNQPLVPTPRTTRTRKESGPPTPEVTQVAEALRTIDSRESATELLQTLTKEPQLKQVASILSLSIPSSLTKPRYISALVEATVGNRLDSEAIRGNATLPY